MLHFWDLKYRVGTLKGELESLDTYGRFYKPWTYKTFVTW